MSKSLRSFPEAMRPQVAKRRIAGNTKGNGYWGAIDAADKLGLGITAPRTTPMSQIEIEERDRKREAKAQEKIRRSRRGRALQNA